MTPQTSPHGSGHSNKIREDVDTQNNRWASEVVDDLERELRGAIKSFKPDDVQLAGIKFEAAYRRIKETIDLMYNRAGLLAEAWAGKDAAAAMVYMQKAYNNAIAIQYTSDIIARALKGHAEIQRAWQDQEREWPNLYDSGSIGLFDDMKEELGKRMRVGILMEQLQKDTADTNHKFLESIRVDDLAPYTSSVAAPSAPSGSSRGVQGASFGGAAWSAVPSAAGTGNGYPPYPGSGGLPGGGTDLAGSTLNGGGGADPFGSTPPGGGGAGGFGGGPGGGFTGGAGGGGLFAGGIPGGSGTGAGRRSSGATGLGGSARGLPGAGAGTGGKSGAGGMLGGAGGAGGAGGDEEERERTSWLAEDEDVWSGDDGAVPPVIG